METRFWIVEVNKEKKFIPKQLGKWKSEGKYILHVAKGIIEIKGRGNIYQIQMKEGESLFFSQEMWKRKHTSHKDTTLAIEYSVEKKANLNSITKIPKISGTPISEEWLKWRYSFIRKSLGPEEIKDKILFLDTEFTCQNIDQQKSPLSVTMLNYDGKVVLNEKVCPRKQVIKVGTQFHGITEREMRCKEDEYEILEKVQQLVKGKILVGHDLVGDLKHLRINPDILLGIRDLAAAVVFGKLGLTKKGQFYKLSSIAKDLLNIQIQEGAHSSREDAETVMALYRFVEDIWIDHDKN